MRGTVTPEAREARPMRRRFAAWARPWISWTGPAICRLAYATRKPIRNARSACARGRRCFLPARVCFPCRMPGDGRMAKARCGVFWRIRRLGRPALCGRCTPRSAAMLVGVLERDGNFSWASAGHPPPLPGPVPEGGGFSKSAAALLPWPGELVLGVREHQRYSTCHLRLAPGQSLLLSTDGAEEAQGPAPIGNSLEAADGELYGDARLAASFDRACREVAPAGGPEAIVARLRADLARHMPAAM